MVQGKITGKYQIKPDYYYGDWYKEGIDPEVTCWHCEKTFLCDCMDATCRLCGAPFAKDRCKEFGFVPYWEREYNKVDVNGQSGTSLSDAKEN